MHAFIHLLIDWLIDSLANCKRIYLYNVCCQILTYLFGCLEPMEKDDRLDKNNEDNVHGSVTYDDDPDDDEAESEIERIDDTSANGLHMAEGRKRIKRAISNKVRVIKILMFADQSLVRR